MSNPIRETDLYQPVRGYLEAQGYAVRSEVHACDITAVLGDELVVVELKRAFGTELLIQATQRQRFADSVYVAFPRPAGKRSSARLKEIQHLLRRLELGLILVTLGGRTPGVEVVFHPVPFQRRRDPARKRAVLREIAGRSGEYNRGGSHREKLVTAYRENALFIAWCLDRLGPLTPKSLRALTTGPKTLAVLSDNVYGWFERVERGVYRVKPEGTAALAAYPDLCARYESQTATSMLAPAE